MAMINQSLSEASPPQRERELDGIFSALSDHRRRYVLSDLVRHFHPVPVHDLVARLATWERGESATDETHRLVRADLEENHLPVMVDAGLVEFSGPGPRLTLTPDGMRAERVRRAAGSALDRPDWE